MEAELWRFASSHPLWFLALTRLLWWALKKSALAIYRERHQLADAVDDIVTVVLRISGSLRRLRGVFKPPPAPVNK